jgi:hypothetical protein
MGVVRKGGGRWILFEHTWRNQDRPLWIERATCDLTSRVAGVRHLQVASEGQDGSRRLTGHPKILKS